MKKLIFSHITQGFWLPSWPPNLIVIILIFAISQPIVKAQADTLSQKEIQWYAPLLGNPSENLVGSPGQDCELIITKSSANFAKQSAIQPSKYRKVLFLLVDSIPDEIKFQDNLEEIHISRGYEYWSRFALKINPIYISEEVLRLPHLKSIYVYDSIHIDAAVNLLNPNVEKLKLWIYKWHYSKTDPSTLQLPENLNWLSTNMVDELEKPILRCKKLKTFEMSMFDKQLPTFFDQITSLENLSVGVSPFDGFPNLNPLNNLKQLSIYNSSFDSNRSYILDLSPIADMGIKHIKFNHANARMFAQLCRFPELESLTITRLVCDSELDPHPFCGSQTLRKLVLAGQMWFKMDSLDIKWNCLRHLAIQHNNDGVQYHLDDYWLNDHMTGKPTYTQLSPILPDIALSPDADTLVLIGIQPSSTRLLAASPGLRHVLLSSNNLESLPPACSTWTQIHYLNICNNLLHDLPDGFQALQVLDTLNLNDNRFTRIPRVLLRGLSPGFVSLTNNQLTRIPHDIDQLDRTEVLDLRGNQIARIPRATLRAITRMPRLKELRLADNPIRAEDIPAEFRGKIVF
jgi:Leucine-rich repeat (LRR) protein